MTDWKGILEPSQHSDWVAPPLVLVRKSNGQLQLCSNYCSTVNVATQKTALDCAHFDHLCWTGLGSLSPDSDSDATVAAYFGLARCCGCSVASRRAVLATRPPFCVASDTFPGASSADRPPSWYAQAHPAGASISSTSPMSL